MSTSQAGMFMKKMAIVLLVTATMDWDPKKPAADKNPSGA